MDSIYMAEDVRFIEESNRIEGIYRPPTEDEIAEYCRFMSLNKVTIDDLIHFVSVYQPNAELRDTASKPDVRVGNHIAPLSSPAIRVSLECILQRANAGGDPYSIHHEYETLHPFTDGNGRSGRMLWRWQMVTAPLGFLHHWYYQSLANGR